MKLMLMIYSNKIKKIIFALSLFSLIFIFTSCNTPDVENTNNNSSDNTSEQSNSDTSNTEPSSTESSETPDDSSNTNNQEQDSSSTESKTGVEIGDNPGDDGYIWGPGQH